MLSRSRLYLLVGWAAVLAVVLVACGDAAATTVPAAITAIPTPLATTPPANATVVAVDNPSSNAASKIEAGRKVFTSICQACHFKGGTSSGGAGPNLSLSRKAGDPDKVRKIVRGGEVGMPAIPTDTVSDADLENIILYLKYIREN